MPPGFSATEAARAGGIRPGNRANRRARMSSPFSSSWGASVMARISAPSTRRSAEASSGIISRARQSISITTASTLSAASDAARWRSCRSCRRHAKPDRPGPASPCHCEPAPVQAVTPRDLPPQPRPEFSIVNWPDGAESAALSRCLPARHGKRHHVSRVRIPSWSDTEPPAATAFRIAR